MNIQRGKERRSFLNLFDVVVYLERYFFFFWKIHLPFLCSHIPFYGWMRSLSLVEQVHPGFFAWFLGRPLYFWGAINWGLWTVGTGAFPHPLFLWSLGHVMMIFNHFFVLILTQIFFSEWRRKNSGSTKFGIAHLSGVSGASENRAKWGRISLKNKHLSLPSFVLIATSPRKKKNAFLLWEFSSYFMEGMAETLSTSRDKTSELLCWHTIFALVFCTAMMWP